MAVSRNFDLADLLTAAGLSMATANSRLAAVNAPTLMREFELILDFPGSVRVAPGVTGVCVKRPAARCALPGGVGSSIRVEATYIAAPSLVPVPPS